MLKVYTLISYNECGKIVAAMQYSGSKNHAKALKMFAKVYPSFPAPTFFRHGLHFFIAQSIKAALPEFDFDKLTQL